MVRACIYIFVCGVALTACSNDKAYVEKTGQLIDHISLYYHDWTTSTFKSLSCQDLAGTSDSVSIRDSSSVYGLVNAFTNAKLVAMPQANDIDVRVCCIFWGHAGTLLHTLSFAQPPVMQLDGKIFERDRQLFDTVLSFLPSDYLKDWPIQ